MLVYHALFVTLLVGTTGFFTALAALNVRHAERTVAEEADLVTDRLGIDDPEELLAYNRLGTALGQLQTWMTLVFVLVALYAGVYADAVAALEATGWPPFVRGTALVVGTVLALQAFTLPFDVVETFVVEDLFEFNQQTLRLYVRDQLVSLVVTVVLVGVLAAAVFLAIDALGGLWWVGAWALFVGFSLLMQVLYPRVIAPLFNDFDPIESGDLHDAVTDVFDRAGFDTDAIYEMDASRRSSHANAYFIGFGRTKRVVLFDTLLEQLSISSVQAVLAHELAHYDRGHIWTQLGASVLWMGALLLGASLLVEATWLYEMFEIAGQPVYAGLLLAVLWLTPVSQLSAPLTNRLSLAHEREADAFAVEVMGAEPMADALADLTGENLSNPFPHPLYETFHYDHPPVPKRLQHIRTVADESEETAA
ncbi:Zinc metalloproteinase [Halorhabdus tiamatea SARL4B]|uniref:Ste24 endopeptidase n=1 Tax=Halorhabdus tiamatea SARL4B TaxID=1033806 RepID=F7PIR5_9EURY|nr:M48 family metallopeptidase [Halorhabdus tiamatea]ERJ05408.1 Zinc metalloproteinase [Halorhabdus tiamatea SARL4B]CCQ33366.1 Ste24 endopeptidase [Halorhabdus tiamatea SARL4B]